MKVHSSVLTATESLNAPAAPATAPTAINNNMRIALQKEFDEKKNLLEQRWDHALNLVTEQMKKQVRQRKKQSNCCHDVTNAHTPNTTFPARRFVLATCREMSRLPLPFQSLMSSSV